jgi:hypothetical protein
MDIDDGGQSGVLSAKRFVSFVDILSVRDSVENECVAMGILSVNDASSFGSLVIVRGSMLGGLLLILDAAAVNEPTLTVEESEKKRCLAEGLPWPHNIYGSTCGIPVGFNG